MTTSTPTSPQAEAAGSFTAVARTGRPSTTSDRSLHGDRVSEAAVDGVVLEQVREVRELEEVVHRDDLDVAARHRRAERRSADPAKAVDADPCHVVGPFPLER